MSNQNYRFRLGTFDCTVVSDGGFYYEHPAATLFPNVPGEQLHPVLRAHGIDPDSWSEWFSPYPGLVIDTGEHRVLIDTGAGGTLPGTGELVSNLREAGIAPGDIDTVILTHGHADHVGGNTGPEGQPTFPHARYVIWAGEWTFWAADEPDLSSMPFPPEIIQLLITVAHNNLRAMESRFERVDREREIVPGIRVLAASGHTPGHMAVLVSSGGETLLCPADAMLHPIHAEQPGWHAAVDLAPQQALATRRRLLELAVQENALLHVFHFPWPGLGHVVPEGEAWRWQPIDVQ
jgi:glyoxylase-like metal-dependent hydrolase (beta-lactamase superfamily II)